MAAISWKISQRKSKFADDLAALDRVQARLALFSFAKSLQSKLNTFQLHSANIKQV